MMKSLIHTLLAIMLSMALVTAHAGDTKEKDANVSWLFALNSSKGQILKQGDKYVLKINRSDIRHILMFSERPARLTRQISTEELNKLWKVGVDSFEKDSPNAAVVIGDLLQTVQFASMQVTKDSVIYTLKPDGKNQIQTTDALPTTIFIDCLGMIEFAGC